MHISKKLYFTAKGQNCESNITHYTTKCKICFCSSINCVYNKKKIQIFGVNMTFISIHEIYIFFTSFDEIKVIFSPKN